jgi:hypothetical protein
MKQNEGMPATLFERLGTLPRKILSVHDHQVVTNLALHDLCGSACFNLKRAAYLVDNPDFDCCRGVAGYSDDEPAVDIERAWGDPDNFEQQMKRSPFNQKVRDLSYASVTKNNVDYVVKELGRQLGITHPSYRTWRIRNGNFGVLLFEQKDQGDTACADRLEDGLSILGFCPLF